MPFLLIKNLPRYDCLIEAAKMFPDLDPSACEAFLHLMQAGDEAFRVVDANLTENRISAGRFTVLMLLLDKASNCAQARTPAELADLSHVTRATMTGLIDTLERDGLVTRQPDANDRRMLSVELTTKGHNLLSKILPPHFQRMAALMAPLDESERKTLVQLLTKIRTQADLMNVPAAPAPAAK
jgi:DNA-binding MarR family transcriptional regulator